MLEALLGSGLVSHEIIYPAVLWYEIKMIDFIERYFGVAADRRTSNYSLIESPYKALGIIAFYILFVKKWGPSLMKNRAAFELRGPLIIYNIIQIIYNAYIVTQSIKIIMTHIIFTGRCLDVVSNDDEVMGPIFGVTNTYCVLKYLDLLDTVFIVLRKRYSQATFLHLFHHSSMCIAPVVIFRYVPFGHLNPAGMLNSVVHVVMYSYYLFCILKPNLKNSVWWKKYITLLQIFQFFVILVYIFYPLSIGDYCGYPVYLMQLALFENIAMVILFSNFYYKTYIRKPKIKAT